MTAYLARRFALMLPTLLLVTLLVFVLIRLIPGDPVQLMLGDNADAGQLAAMRRELGLDQALPLQFAHWLARLAQGDLGHSLTDGQPVLPMLLERFTVSASIVVVAVAVATALAVPAGLLAAWQHGGVLDLAIVGAATVLLSIPGFWLGLLLLLLFGLKLGWLPVVGYVALADDFRQGLSFIVLPVLTLALVETGALVRMARAGALEVLGQEYVTHARAKGASEARVLLRHVLPNAFAPTLTLVGLILGHLLGGIAVLETVFTLPGLGRALVDAILARDYPVVQGALLFAAGVYLLVNLLVDLAYPIFDPRVREGGR